MTEDTRSTCTVFRPCVSEHKEKWAQLRHMHVHAYVFTHVYSVLVNPLPCGDGQEMIEGESSCCSLQSHI